MPAEDYQINVHEISIRHERFMAVSHCVVTEKVPAKYRSLKVADASLDKCSIFVDWGGIAWARQRMSVRRGRKSAKKRFRILVQSQEGLERLY